MVDKPLYKGGQLLLLNVALGLGTFIQILDSSITNVAIPYIAGNLSVSADEGTWVITSFAASNAIVSTINRLALQLLWKGASIRYFSIALYLHITPMRTSEQSDDIGYFKSCPRGCRRLSDPIITKLVNC